MKQKNIVVVVLLAIIIACVIAGIFIYRNYFLSEASVTRGTTISCTLDLNPNTGTEGSSFNISVGGLTGVPAGIDLKITWDDATLSTINTSGAGNYSVGANVPGGASTGEHTVRIQETKTISASAEIPGRVVLIRCSSVFRVTAGGGQSPTPTTNTEASSAAPTPASTSTTATVPAPTTTTTVKTEEGMSQQTPNSTKNAQSATTSATASLTTSPATTAPSQQVQEENGQSVFSVDKEKALADGKDKVTISILLKDGSGNIVKDSPPTIEVSGGGNILSEIKQEGDNYIASLASRVPEEKNIKVVAKDIELPELKVVFVESEPASAVTTAKSPLKIFEGPAIIAWFQAWWFWLLIVLAFILALYLLYKMRQRLHESTRNGNDGQSR